MRRTRSGIVRWSALAGMRCCRRAGRRAGQAAALLGVDRQRPGDDAHRPGPQLSRHLALQAPRPAGPGGQDLSATGGMIEDPDGTRGLDAGDAAQRPAHRDRQAGRAARDPRRARRRRQSAIAPSMASSGRIDNATTAGAGSRSASAKAISARPTSGASARMRCGHPGLTRAFSGRTRMRGKGDE